MMVRNLIRELTLESYTKELLKTIKENPDAILETSSPPEIFEKAGATWFGCVLLYEEKEKE